MNRRALLSRLTGAGVVFGFGGCLGDAPDASSDNVAECPSVWPDAGRTICANQAESETGALDLDPETEPFTVVPGDSAVESLRLTLRNQASRTFVADPGRWRLLAWTGDTWTETALGQRTGESIALSPGEAHEWSLSLRPHPTPQTRDTTFITADIDDGMYLFAVSGVLGQGSDARRIECHAQFELVERRATQES